MLSARLTHGGIMANYICTAACRHCAYACSPDRTGDYITRETAGRVTEELRRGGCRSVHIGGGEPFLNFEGLLGLLEVLRRGGIPVDYVETNGCWSGDEAEVRRRLRELAALRADAFCISVDPYHAEYIPVEAPLRLARICREAGFEFFLWKQQFLPTLSKLDMSRSHSREELEATLGKDYVWDAATAYGIGFGGRALNIEEEYRPRKPLGQVVSHTPCTRLLSTGHFHVDYAGRFIPPGCTGIVIPLREIVDGVPSGKYLAFEALYSGGNAALLALAEEKGFAPDPGGYPSPCALCFHLRRFLAGDASCPELDPEHYEAALGWY